MAVVRCVLAGDGADATAIRMEGPTMGLDLDDVLATAETVKKLISSGWLKRVGSLFDIVRDLKNGDLNSILRAYQNHFHLPADGTLNNRTLEHLSMPRFCGRPDREHVSEQGLRPMDEVRWFATNPGDMPGLTGREFLEALDECWTYLPTVCGITARNVATRDEANNLVQVGSIDGSMGTLAWSELWNGVPTVLHQMYDNGDRWMRQSGPLSSSSTLDVLRVIIHESCHLLGLGHDQEDMTALMAPTYSLTVDRCTPRDISRLQRIYGPPKSVTKPVGPGNAKPPIPTKAFSVQAIVEETAEGVTIRIPGVSMKNV